MKKFRTFKRKRTYGGRYSSKTKSVAVRALRTAKYAKALARPEKYFLDNAVIGDSIDFNGKVELISGVAAGNDDNNRSGNSIRVRSLLFNFDIKGNSQNPSNSVRIMLVQDKQNIGTTPTMADILQYTGDQRAVISPLNVDHVTRYRVLYDRRFVFANMANYVSTVATVSPAGRYIGSRYFKLWDYLRFTGINATDVYSNAIYLCMVSDVGTNDPVMTWSTRMGYNDQ